MHVTWVSEGTVNAKQYAQVLEKYRWLSLISWKHLLHYEIWTNGSTNCWRAERQTEIFHFQSYRIWSSNFLSVCKVLLKNEATHPSTPCPSFLCCCCYWHQIQSKNILKRHLSFLLERLIYFLCVKIICNSLHCFHFSQKVRPYTATPKYLVHNGKPRRAT